MQPRYGYTKDQAGASIDPKRRKTVMERRNRLARGSSTPRKLRSPVVFRRYLNRPDRPRRVDRYISYFGDERYREAYARG